MTDDVIHSTQYYFKHINGTILANLQCRTLNLGGLIVLQETHLLLSKIPFPWQLTSRRKKENKMLCTVKVTYPHVIRHTVNL